MSVLLQGCFQKRPEATTRFSLWGYPCLRFSAYPMCSLQEIKLPYGIQTTPCRTETKYERGFIQNMNKEQWINSRNATVLKTARGFLRGAYLSLIWSLVLVVVNVIHAILAIPIAFSTPTILWTLLVMICSAIIGGLLFNLHLSTKKFMSKYGFFYNNEY